jgi:hypothetical protein
MNNLTFIIGFAASVVTITSASIATIRYLGRAGAIEEAAERLGVDLAMLALPPEPENPAIHTEERNKRATFLIERFHTEEIEEALRSIANGSGAGFNADDDYSTNNLVELACSQVAPGAVIETALKGEGAHPRKRIMGQHLTDEELSDLVDERELWPDPIRAVAQLRDDRSRAYAWVLSDDATEEDRASLAKEIEETFVQMNQSEPEALHFIVRNIEELKELESETVENYVKPWLKEPNNDEEANE